MTSSPARRAVIFFTFALAFPVFVMGCPKKQPPVVDAGDEGDGAPDAGPKKWTGPGVNPNQAKIQMCCRAMRAQAKTLGASPEAFQLTAAAAQCDVFAKQVGPAGNAPELNQLRQVLRSVKLPNGCSF